MSLQTLDSDKSGALSAQEFAASVRKLVWPPSLQYLSPVLPSASTDRSSRHMLGAHLGQWALWRAKKCAFKMLSRQLSNL
jgi:hypothetical protein